MAHHVAIYPGTFDPLTLGHHDIMRRAARICDHLIIGVAENVGKNPLFSVSERFDIVSQVIDKDEKMVIIPDKVTVKTFNNFLLILRGQKQASILIRGLRAVQILNMNFRWQRK